MTDADRNPDAIPELTPEQARETLRASAHARSTLARQGRWIRRYLAGFAVATVGLVLAVGLGGRSGAIGGLGAWAIALAVLIPYALHQGVSPRHLGRRIGLVIPAWAVLYGLTLAVGLPGFAGNPAFWVPAALLTAIPFALGAALPLGASPDSSPDETTTTSVPA